NITVNIVIAGLSGSAVADAAATGGVLIPAMEKEGYGKTFAAAITAAASTMGPIIPPSIPMIIFGLMTGVSIADLFLGGVVPGLIMALVLFGSCYFIAIRRNHPKREGRVSLREIGTTFWRASWALILPFIVLGGIFSGIMTVTESGAVAVVYTLFVGIFVYQELNWRMLPRLFFRTAYNTGIILAVIATIQILTHLMAEMKFTTLLANTILMITDNKYLILLIINIFLLLVGCLVDPFTALFLLIPILVPVVQKVGVDPIHFGVVMVLNLMIGLSTPPVGGLLFVTTVMAKVRMNELVREIYPFILLFIGVLFLITYVPALVLFLPHLMK
ncbi:MAG: TRAP transporter large permease, partial [Deltaproteobacteria bacterium]|nr:TRAP transporter large permease [Deltaproteobacteria bacterium]